MILIIGAGSRTGRALARLLRETGTPVRMLTRSAPGPDEVAGDLADAASLDRAMAGADAVFLLSSAAPTELAWHRNAIEAAARAGVGHLVRSSILGADPASLAGSSATTARPTSCCGPPGCRSRSCGPTSTCTT